MTRLLFIFLFLSSCNGSATQVAKTQIVSYQTQIEASQPDSLLVNIQNKIYTAFVQGIMSKDNTKLANISQELGILYNKRNEKLFLYWRSYLQYYSAIYYLEKGDKQNSEKEIDKGISWLENMKNKNSEDYALLSLLQGFGIQFKGIRAMFISREIKKNAHTAIAMDSTNLRAYYVYASNDFYTPKVYGGGREVEKYLLKAISLPVQKIKNVYLPSWGKKESFEMIIKLYIKQEKWGLAKKYFQEGIKEYPNSYEIKELASKLVGK